MKAVIVGTKMDAIFVSANHQTNQMKDVLLSNAKFIVNMVMRRMIMDARLALAKKKNILTTIMLYQNVNPLLAECIAPEGTKKTKGDAKYANAKVHQTPDVSLYSALTIVQKVSVKMCLDVILVNVRKVSSQNQKQELAHHLNAITIVRMVSAKMIEGVKCVIVIFLKGENVQTMGVITLVKMDMKRIIMAVNHAPVWSVMNSFVIFIVRMVMRKPTQGVRYVNARVPIRFLIQLVPTALLE